MADKLKNKILLADSLKGLMRKQPFSKISIQDICDDAGISRRNFYRYFQDKYALLNWIYTEDLGARVPTDDSMVVQDYVPYICRIVYEDPQFYTNALSVTGQNSFRSYFRERMYPKFMHDYGDLFSTDASARFYVDHFTEAIFDSILMWLKSDPCLPPDEFSEYAIRSTAQVAKRLYENMEAHQEHKRQ